MSTFEQSLISLTSTGSIAARYQATFGGNVPARGVLAYLQSAAQGGYGAQLANSLIKAGAVGLEALKFGAKQRLQEAAEEGMEEGDGNKGFKENREAMSEGEAMSKGE